MVVPKNILKNRARKIRRLSGLCCRCFACKATTGTRCDKCHEKDKIYESERQATCRRNEICPVCRKNNLYADYACCLSCYKKDPHRRNFDFNPSYYDIG